MMGERMKSWRSKLRSWATGHGEPLAAEQATEQAEDTATPTRWARRHPGRIAVEFDLSGQEHTVLRSKHREGEASHTKNQTPPRKRRKVTAHVRRIAEHRRRADHLFTRRHPDPLNRRYKFTPAQRHVLDELAKNEAARVLH